LWATKGEPEAQKPSLGFVMGVGCEKPMSHLVIFHILNGCWTVILVITAFIVVGRLMQTECEEIIEQSNAK
jgi:hypothetical protein